MDTIREGYPEMHKRCAETRMGFIHDSNTDSIWDASEEEREELWQHLYAQPGFGMVSETTKPKMLRDQQLI